MKNLIVFCLAIIFLASCSTSNNVASNKLIQKRKYKKGWHVNSTQKIEKTANSEEVAYTNQEEEFVSEESKTKDSTYSFQATVNQEPNSRINDSVINGEETKSTLNFVKKLKEIKLSKIIEANLPTLEFPIPEEDQVSNESQVTSAPIDESDKRVLLAILGVLILLFTGIAPLAVFVAIGRGVALRVSAILYIITWLLFIAFVIALFGLVVTTAIAVFVSSAVILTVLGILVILMALATFIHALVSIIRGY